MHVDYSLLSWRRQRKIPRPRNLPCSPEIILIDQERYALLHFIFIFILFDRTLKFVTADVMPKAGSCILPYIIRYHHDINQQVTHQDQRSSTPIHTIKRNLTSTRSTTCCTLRIFQDEIPTSTFFCFLGHQLTTYSSILPHLSGLITGHTGEWDSKREMLSDGRLSSDSPRMEEDDRHKPQPKN